MGTSQSNPGPNGKSPLVPPWADDQPEQPLPPPPHRRFQQFRRKLGDFVKSGSSTDLRSALGHYARSGYGSGEIASRRLGAVSKSGAGLFGALSQGHAPNLLAGLPELNLASLAGETCVAAINKIADFLTPSNGDADKIRAAINWGLINALDGVGIFDPNQITDEVIVNTMIGYLSESIFLLIVTDGGNAWTRAQTPLQEIKAENALRELVKVVVDRKMSPKLGVNVRSISRNEMMLLQRQVVSDVWTEWEKYA